MKVNFLNSITKPTRIFNTSQIPILITCDDFNDYVIKYNKYGKLPLFYEYLAACYLKIWKLGVPDFAIIRIDKEQIFGFHPDIQPYYFDTECFGSKYSKDYQEVNSYLSSLNSYHRKKFINKVELLEIILFDIWLSNEDRNHNNYNLLFDLANQNRFIPIDHQYIFNSGTIEYLNLLTYQDTLFYSPFVQNLFSKRDFEDGTIIEALKLKFEYNIKECKRLNEAILDNIPDSWKIDKDRWKKELNDKIVKDIWLDRTWSCFCEYLQNMLNRVI